MGNRVIGVFDKLIDAVIVIICVLLLLIGVYSVLDELWLYNNAQDRSLLTYRPDLDSILTPERKISENQIGWVYIDDTTIDYPIMQGKDNFEFLNKDPYGEFSLSGSIFLDSYNDPELTDDYSLIYGHHMAGKAMFGALDEFKKKDYFDKHRKGKIITSSKTYEFNIFAVCSAKANDMVLFAPQMATYNDVMNLLKSRALIYVNPAQGERIVALSTCTSDANEERLLVIGTIKERQGNNDTPKK